MAGARSFFQISPMDEGSQGLRASFTAFPGKDLDGKGSSWAQIVMHMGASTIDSSFIHYTTAPKKSRRVMRCVAVQMWMSITDRGCR